jgi:hypothetical protein
MFGLAGGRRRGRNERAHPGVLVKVEREDQLRPVESAAAPTYNKTVHAVEGYRGQAADDRAAASGQRKGITQVMAGNSKRTGGPSGPTAGYGFLSSGTSVSGGREAG